MENQELIKLLTVIKETSMTDFKNLAAINVGSNHKTKDEIVNQVCSYAQKAMNLQNRLHQALEWIQEGYTFDQWMECALERVNRTNQAKMDRDSSMEELTRVTEIIVQLS